MSPTTTFGLTPLAMCMGLAACSPRPAPAPREASSPAPVEAFVAPAPAPAPAPDPIGASQTPIPSDVRASLATPVPPPKRNVEPLVEASGPLTEPQRAVLGAVAVCVQRAVDKGSRPEDSSLIVNVTVEPTGAVSSVDIDGASPRLKACAEPEIRKVRYPSTDDTAGVRVVQYPMDVSREDADAD